MEDNMISFEILLAYMLSIASVTVSVYSTIMNQRRLNKVDIESNANNLTIMLVKLENIEKHMSKIEYKSDDMSKHYQELRDKVIVCEQSQKAYWHRLEAVENTCRKQHNVKLGRADANYDDFIKNLDG